MDLKVYDKASWINTVWDGLHNLYPDQMTEESWDDVCTAMHWIIKELGYELNEDGDYVEIQR